MRSDFSYASTGMGITNVFTGSETRPGWTAGAGLEYLITENWSVFAEYNHLDFGSDTLDTRLVTVQAAEPVRIDRRIDTVMLGVNFRIGSSAR